jgi:hypothetical protein
MLNSPDHKRNANQNYSKISSHPSENGYLLEQKQQQKDGAK